MHLAVEELVDYFLGCLILEEEETVELHSADCDQCVDVARKIYQSNSQLEGLRERVATVNSVSVEESGFVR
jgi:hypothetical protein